MARKRGINGQENKVLTALVGAGKTGLRSEELNKVCFRYSALIHTLRHKRGLNIVTKRRSGTKLVKFVLTNPKDAVAATPPPTPVDHVLDMLSSTKGAFITTAELAKALGMPKPTVYAAVTKLKAQFPIEESMRWTPTRGKKPLGYRLTSGGK